MKTNKHFYTLAALVAVMFCPNYVYGITNTTSRVSSTNMMHSVVLTQDMFPPLPDLEQLEDFIVIKVAGKRVSFDQITVLAKKTILIIARRTIPVLGSRKGSPVELLNIMIYPPPLPDDYSIGLGRNTPPRL